MVPTAVPTDTNLPFLDEDAAARVVHADNKRFLREMHYKGIGPPRITIGRKILYRRDALIAWMQKFESKPRESKPRRRRKAVTA